MRSKLTGDVMWIKESDISTEAFFHTATPKLKSASIQCPDSEQKMKMKRRKFTCIQFRIGRGHQDYQQGHCDVGQSV